MDCESCSCRLHHFAVQVVSSRSAEVHSACVLALLLFAVKLRFFLALRWKGNCRPSPPDEKRRVHLAPSADVSMHCTRHISSHARPTAGKRGVYMGRHHGCCSPLAPRRGECAWVGWYGGALLRLTTLRPREIGGPSIHGSRKAPCIQYEGWRRRGREKRPAALY